MTLVLSWTLTLAAFVAAGWAALLAVSFLFSVVGLHLAGSPRPVTSNGDAAIARAASACHDTGLTGWALVQEAQHLVAQQMPEFGFFNAFDFPPRAFARGVGYCWQRAGALQLILERLGFRVRMVHAFLNRFPPTVSKGRLVPSIVCGHAWLRVRIGDEIRDVCPGSPDNVPGRVHFESLSRVHAWGPGIFLLSYLGSPIAIMLAFVVERVLRSRAPTR